MLQGIIESWSYLGITFILILTGCGLPVPEEVPIIAAGLLASQGHLDPWCAFLSCLVGALVGDAAMYGIGYHWGRNLIKSHPRLAYLLHAEREAKVEKMLRSHGLKVLFLARFMVGVRSPVYFSAGVLRIPFRKFVLMDLLCATAVVGVFFGLTLLFGEHIARLFRKAEIGLTVGVLVAIAAVVGYFYYRGRKRLARLAAKQALRRMKASERAERQLRREENTVA